eukprot:gene23385-30306_t
MFKKIVTYVIYATRPLWDYELHEELSRWKTVPNLGVFDDDNEIVCAAHNFSVRKNLHRRSGILLFDVFLFNSEWDILEIRLHELSKVVDRFVILEAECTFSGGWKPLTFQKILSGNHSLYSRYRRFEQKIFIYSPPPNYCTEHYTLRGFHAENDLRSHALTATLDA